MPRRPWGLSCVSATDTFPSSSGSQEIHTQQDVEHTLLWMFSRSVLSDSDSDCSPPAPLSTGFPSKNTGVGCHALLQGSS